MNDIEKRSQLVQAPGPEEHQWGECFIAVRDGDMVHTLSGIAFEFEREYDQEMRFDGFRVSMLPTDEITVRISFRGKVVQELRPFDGKVVPT